jgi:hypothetical protein
VRRSIDAAVNRMLNEIADLCEASEGDRSGEQETGAGDRGG